MALTDIGERMALDATLTGTLTALYFRAWGSRWRYRGFGRELCAAVDRLWCGSDKLGHDDSV